MKYFAYGSNMLSERLLARIKAENPTPHALERQAVGCDHCSRSGLAGLTTVREYPPPSVRGIPGTSYSFHWRIEYAVPDSQEAGTSYAEGNCLYFPSHTDCIVVVARKTMTIFARRQGALLTVVLALAIAGCIQLPFSDRRTTFGKERDWQQRFFAEHLTGIERVGDSGARVLTDGWIVSMDGRKDFVIYRGQKFRRSPDHHAWAFYTLKEARQAGVVLAYESGFDHHSFGKDLVTVDRGKIEIPYR